MIRGTTPTHTIAVDIDLRDAEVIYVTYKQGDKLVLELEKANLAIAENEISVTLTQEQTLAFGANRMVSVQIRARFHDGTAVASNIMQTTVSAILKNGVI